MILLRVFMKKKINFMTLDQYVIIVHIDEKLVCSTLLLNESICESV